MGAIQLLAASLNVEFTFDVVNKNRLEEDKKNGKYLKVEIEYYVTYPSNNSQSNVFLLKYFLWDFIRLYINKPKENCKTNPNCSVLKHY